MGQKRWDLKFLTPRGRDENKNACTTVYLHLQHPLTVSAVDWRCTVAAPSQGCFDRHRTAANWTRPVLALGCSWGGRQDEQSIRRVPPACLRVLILDVQVQDKAARLFQCVLQPRRTTETGKMMEETAFYLIMQQSSCLLFLLSELRVNRNGFWMKLTWKGCWEGQHWAAPSKQGESTKTVAVAGSNPASCSFMLADKSFIPLCSILEKTIDFCTIWEDKRFSNYLTLVLKEAFAS